MTDSPPAVVAEGFGWRYRTRSAAALSEVSFRLEPGQVLLVLGPSGCGKSSLARALAGLVPHVIPGTWTGRLAVGDLEVPETPARILGERVGIVFQDPESQLVMARVDDEVAFGLENRGWPLDAMRARVPAVLHEVGLAGFERRGTATLSGGEQQRLAVADVLAPAPALLVFDEPTANLDPPGMHRVFALLASLAEERAHTMVIVEHRLDAALPLADAVLVLGDDGRQIAFGSPDAVGRKHAATLDRLGSWVPRPWRRWVASDRAPAVPVPLAAATEDRDVPAPAALAEPASVAAASIPNPVASPVPASRTATRAAPAAASAKGSAPLPGVAVRATHLTVRNPSSAAGDPPPALDGVSFEVREGERVALVGPNGSGKSTLLFAVAGLRRPSVGRALVTLDGFGGDAGSVDPSRLTPDRLCRTIGLVFQDPEVGFIGRTVAAEAAAGSVHEPDDPVIAGVLDRFGLGHLAEVDPFRLSQGEQRRLSLGAHALRRPRILLLDEPTFGLDRAGSDAVSELLDGLRADGQAQLMATHDPRLLAGCDRVLALEAGRVVFDGSPDAFDAAPPYDPAEPWRGVAAQ